MVSLPVRLAGVAFLFAVAPLVANAQQPAPATRVWTAVNGQKFQAKLIGVEGTNAVFQLANGQTTKVALQQLAASDQAAIRGSAAPTPVARPRTWPTVVEVPSNSIEITIGEQDAAKRRYVYKSQSFEFVSQDKLAGSVMKEVARTFEATRALVAALPWGVHPKPPADLGFYQARLFVTREDYFADGGPVNSGGVYFPKDRVFRIPFPTLGLEMRGKTWFKQEKDYSGETLVHEVTHQMMHDFLPFLPNWIAEGTAEYTGSLPYNAGRFQAGSHARGLKDYIAKAAAVGARTAEFRPFGEHISMKDDSWRSLSARPHSQHLLYFQSYLLVYYFCHLDGDGKGARFLKYLDAIAGARDEWSRSVMKPTAERLEEFGIEKLSLLFDGRDAVTLEADIRNGFKKIGIKL